MTEPVAIAFWTILILGPVPIWHLLLHSFLPAWKGSPRTFYAAAAAVWGLFLPFSWHLAWGSALLFVPPAWVKLICLCASVAALLTTLWSMITLTPRRFFVWAVLRPEENKPELILRGPYRFTPHPTYLSTVVAAASGFLASGEAVLLGAFCAISLLLTRVIVLEQRELRMRLKASLPEPARETVASSSSGLAPVPNATRP